MLNLVRGSCKVVKIESHDLPKLINFISTQFEVSVQGEFTEQRLNDIFAASQEGNVIVLVTKEMKENLTEKDMSYLILLKVELDELLSAFVNNRIQSPIVNNIKLSPRLLIVRTVGQVEKVITQVEKDIHGTIEDTEHVYDKSSSGTIVLFSNNALHKPINIMTTYAKCVHTTASYYEVLRYLRNQNLKYLNIGIDNNDWFELKIKIYDAYGHFDLHYKRMRYILEKLEMGIILGETWGKDVASVFQTVGIYKVRFFTFKDPLEIKKILVGLEYLNEDERICDFDLYVKKKKIRWDQVRTDTIKGKRELGVFYRKNMLNQLSDEEKQMLFEMDNEVRATREPHYNKP